MPSMGLTVLTAVPTVVLTMPVLLLAAGLTASPTAAAVSHRAAAGPRLPLLIIDLRSLPDVYVTALQSRPFRLA